MRLGMVGLGKMGGNMVQRLARGGHQVVVHDRDPEVTARIGAFDGAEPAASLDEIVAKLDAPRVVWVMVPAGGATEQVLQDLAARVQPGDVLIDGGNSNFKDTQRRAADLAGRGIRLVDAGTSGGVWGLENGYCLMVGGDVDAVGLCEPPFVTLAPQDGYAHVGPVRRGALHQDGAQRHRVRAAAGVRRRVRDPAQVAGWGWTCAASRTCGTTAAWSAPGCWSCWSAPTPPRGRSWSASAAGWRIRGEGRWTVETALDLDVPAPVITLSLLARFRSRQEESYGAQVIAALRNQFGGHAIKEAAPDGRGAAMSDDPQLPDVPLPPATGETPLRTPDGRRRCSASAAPIRWRWSSSAARATWRGAS